LPARATSGLPTLSQAAKSGVGRPPIQVSAVTTESGFVERLAAGGFGATWLSVDNVDG